MTRQVAGHAAPAAIERAAEHVAGARTVVVLTGAGVSAESGVPTFRGSDGLWKSFHPESLATPEAFARDPRLVWEWYGWRRELVSRCRPNAAHDALARFASRRPGVRVITQNVDGLHSEAAEALGEAAADAATPLELHGSLFRMRCTGCGAVRAGREPVDASTHASLPRCGACSALFRPDVVWFGEQLDARVLDEAMRLAAAAELCLVVGTSGVVHPAAGLAYMTVQGGGDVIEVNPEPTPITGLAAISVRGKAGEVLAQLLRVR